MASQKQPCKFQRKKSGNCTTLKNWRLLLFNQRQRIEMTQQTNKRTNKRKNKRTNERPNQHTNQQTHKQTNKPTDRQTNPSSNKQTNQPTNKRNKQNTTCRNKTCRLATNQRRFLCVCVCGCLVLVSGLCACPPSGGLPLARGGPCRAQPWSACFRPWAPYGARFKGQARAGEAKLYLLVVREARRRQRNLWV